MRIPAFVVLIAVIPICTFAATPLEPVVLGPTPGNVSFTATAFAGGKYLTVWRQQMMPYTGIWGAFSDVDGKPLGPAFAVIPTSNALDLRLFADGASFMLYWNEANTSAAVARIDGGGEVTLRKAIEMPPVLRVDAFVAGWAMAVTTSGERQTLIVDSQGKIISKGIALSNAWGSPAAFAGQQSFFLTTRAPALVLSRYSLNGELLQTLNLSGDQCQMTTSPCSAIGSLQESASGTILLALFDQAGFAAGPQLATMTIGADGRFSDRHPVTTAFTNVRRVDLRKVGAQTWLVVTGGATSSGPFEVEARPLDENGIPTGDAVRLIGGLDIYETVALAREGTALFAATSPGTAERQVQTFLFRELKPVESHVLSITPTVQDETQVASNGREYLAVWSDINNVYHRRVHWAVLDGAGQRRSEIFSAAGEPVRHSLVSNGLDYLMLTGSGAHSVRAIRIASDGTMLGEIPITDNLSPYSWVDTGAAVVPTSAGYLVAWTDGDVLYSSVISSSGIATVPHEVLRITDQEIGWRKTYEDAALGWNGREVLLAVRRSRHVFTGFPTGDFSWDELQAFRLTADGRLKSPDPVVFDSGGYRPLVASSGDAFLIASWDDRFVVRDDGSVTAFTPLNEAVSTDLVWDGSTYILAGRFTVERLARDGASLGTAVNDRLDGTVDVAVDTEGHLVIVASESNGSGPLRAHSYIPSDLTPIPPKRRRAAGH